VLETPFSPTDCSPCLQCEKVSAAVEPVRSQDCVRSRKKGQCYRRGVGAGGVGQEGLWDWECYMYVDPPPLSARSLELSILRNNDRHN
jgi:hypothetical protein